MILAERCIKFGVSAEAQGTLFGFIVNYLVGEGRADIRPISSQSAVVDRLVEAQQEARAAAKAEIAELIKNEFGKEVVWL